MAKDVLVTRWWWVRHAPVVAPEPGIIGQRDLAADLTDGHGLGALAARLPSRGVLVTSDLARAVETARAVAASALEHRPAVPELREQSFGRWEGAAFDTLDRAEPEAVRRFWSDPAGARPPGGESFADVRRRIAVVVRRLCEFHRGRDVVCVAHAGPIRAALALALDLEDTRALAFAVEPLSLTRIERLEHGSERVWRVVAVNDLGV